MDPLSQVISFLELRNYRVGGFEADRPVAARLEAADAIVSQLQKRDDLGQRIHHWTISNKM